MKKMIFSVAIFGTLHPLSKVLLSTGIPLSFFCILYIGIRLVIQLVYITYSNEITFGIKTKFFKLIILGLIGAALQFFEFKGIERGVTPGTVTLLMFTYPIWTTLFDMLKKHMSISLTKLISPLLAIFGVFLISNLTFSLESKLNFNMLYPLLAGFFVAIWITFSNKLVTDGIDTLQVSFFYDLFSFFALLVFLSKDLSADYINFIYWFSPLNITYMTLFSIFIGLIPNLLFYQASKEVKSDKAGMIMATEPVYSVFYSSILWGAQYEISLAIGTFFIILANIQITKIWILLSKKIINLTPVKKQVRH